MVPGVALPYTFMDLTLRIVARSSCSSLRNEPRIDQRFWNGWNGSNVGSSQKCTQVKYMIPQKFLDFKYENYVKIFGGDLFWCGDGQSINMSICPCCFFSKHGGAKRKYVKQIAGIDHLLHQIS